ncbi:hypothetical protein GVO57_07845 [Sphingomonas changnyeongensis]|uniref:TolA-binding protein n=1 Tax=Sphingomonas changnyeongensis TaxID=2698679 RepID=A0A7Z2NWR2_9SPHN|nr:tetratricopeptide repeat protein [Sphingomonas changnyeongensis]QHL90760.1 hypothetical protein GVO57_07845 [Sphingomonas changnyeongensis]
MPKPFLAFLLLSVALPASAQVAAPDLTGRVTKIEKELRAVQRKVFPGGTPVEPEMTVAPQTATPAGTPATPPLADLTARVDALEAALRTVTGQSEQNAFRLGQLEERLARIEAAAAAAQPAAAEPGTAQPGASAQPGDPAQPGTGAADAGGDMAAPRATAPAATRPAPAAPAPRPTPAAVSPAPARTVTADTAATTVLRPRTGDDAEDSYIHGFRLWQAKDYAAAEAELKKVVEKHPEHRRASYAQNLLGRLYMDDGKIALAAVAFYENYQKFPNGARATESLLSLGEALVQLKKPADACKVYLELDSVYGRSLTAAQKAQFDKGRKAARCR